MQSQTELIATLTEQAEAKRRRVTALEGELRETREALAYLSGQLAILRQITLDLPIRRTGGDDGTTHTPEM